MPITADATGLIALGKVNRIELLSHLATDIYVSPWVRQRELRAHAAQVNSAIAGQWLHEVTPSKSVVDDLIRSTSLDQGEAESI